MLRRWSTQLSARFLICSGARSFSSQQGFKIPFEKTTSINLKQILPLEEYKQIRPKVLALQSQLRKERRVHIGPYASITFENFDLMWSQIHEMLFIEGGGEEQAKEEIEAYEPLVPKGNNLVFTFMFEIDDKQRRDNILFQLGHVEDMIQLVFNNHKITALSASADDIDRTTADGKTSSIHFLRFNLTPEQVKEFKNLSESPEVKIMHERYPHSVSLSSALLSRLQADLEE